VKAWVDAVGIAGSTLRVTAPDPLPAERDTLAVATAIRVFEHFRALECLVLQGGSREASLTRADVQGLLAPLGFGALRDGRWSQVLARAVPALLEDERAPGRKRPTQLRHGGGDSPVSPGRRPFAQFRPTNAGAVGVAL
jgi:hypothetical protein